MVTAPAASGEAPTADAVAERMEALLRADPTSFSFFQLVRLLGRLRPDRAPVGYWADPDDELARFGATPSLSFPASEVRELELPPAGMEEPARIRVNFFGLIGPQGVLPSAYTEHVAGRVRARDTAMRDFLDIFQHRALSLFYRVWERPHYAVAHEAGREDRLLDHLLDVAGLGTTGLRHRLPVPDEMLGFHAGLLGGVRSADGLARLIGDYFEVPAAVEEFVGEWRTLTTGGQCAVGEDDEAARLGAGVLGDAVWDPQSRVRLRLGPLTRRVFDAFLPGGQAHEALRALARLYADDQVGVDAQLVLARDEVPGSVLGDPHGPALGRGSWLRSRPMARDPDDTTFPLC